MSSTSRSPKVRLSFFSIENSERGITLVLFALLLTVIVMIVSVVVDLGKQELALTQLRQAADAAALSGARRLNGRPDGWRAAKLAAAMVLRRYPIHGVAESWQSNLALRDGTVAYWDSTPSTGYPVPPPQLDRGVSGESGEFHIAVERGIIRAKETNPNETEFVSLEAAPNGESMSGDAYIFANALRVDVKLDTLPGIFTKIFSSLGFSNLTARSYAVMDSAMERMVAPIAISYDDLMLDTNPQTYSATHQSPYFYPELEQARELEVGVLNKTGRQDMLDETQTLDRDPLGQVPAREFIDRGLTRFRSFYRPPYTTFYSLADAPGYPPDICNQGQRTGTGPNCKAIPIEAYFAYPGVEDPTPELIVAGFRDGVKAKVGGIVGGLKSLGSLSSDANLVNTLAAAINASSTTFQDFFMMGGTPLPNYPYLRTTREGLNNPAGPGEVLDLQGRPDRGDKELLLGEDVSADVFDLLISYPSNEAMAEGDTTAPKQRFIMGEMSAQAPGNPPVQSFPSGLGQLNFLNPMCHFDAVPVNSLTQNKVKEVYAMVIAPRKGVTESGRKINFRDFAAMFAGGPQNAIAPVKETVPTIVGFVKIGIFDGNTLALNVRFDARTYGTHPNEDVHTQTSTPAYGNPGSNNYVVDDNPAYIDLTGDTAFNRDVQTYTGKVDETYACYDQAGSTGSRSGCGDVEPPPSMDSIANLFECFDFSFLKEEGVLDDVASDLESLSEPKMSCISSEADCGVENSSQCPGCAPPGTGCCDRWTYGSGQTKIIDKFLKVLSKHMQEPIRANPNTHCLYNLRSESEDSNDLNSYEALQPLTPGFGCGGLRGRLKAFPGRRQGTNDPADGDYVSLVSGEQWSRQNTALVNVDE